MIEGRIVDIIITVVTTVLASSGFWAVIQSWNNTKGAQAQMLKGLAHDRILVLAESYIDRGYISTDEYENLVDYLYDPYVKLGGNGTAKRAIDEVKRLPIRKS